MYTMRQLEASRGGIVLPQDPATPIADAIRFATFLICVPFAGCSLAWAILQLVLS